MPRGTSQYHQTSSKKNFDTRRTAAKTCTDGTTTLVLLGVLVILRGFYRPGWTNWAKGSLGQTLSPVSRDVACSTWGHHQQAGKPPPFKERGAWQHPESLPLTPWSHPPPHRTLGHRVGGQQRPAAGTRRSSLGTSSPAHRRCSQTSAPRSGARLTRRQQRQSPPCTSLAMSTGIKELFYAVSSCSSFKCFKINGL